MQMRKDYSKINLIYFSLDVGPFFIFYFFVFYVLHLTVINKAININNMLVQTLKALRGAICTFICVRSSFQSQRLKLEVSFNGGS